MDEQINGTQAPKRRRRAEAQKKAFEEFDRLQQEELADEGSIKEEFEQPQLHAHTDAEFGVKESAQSSKVNRPTMPRPNHVQQQVWNEDDDDDDFDDDYEHRSRKNRGGGGCLIGVIIALILIIAVRGPVKFICVLWENKIQKIK